MNPTLLKLTIMLLSWLSTNDPQATSGESGASRTQRDSQQLPADRAFAQPTVTSFDRACSKEFGMLVCRNVPATTAPTEDAGEKTEPVTRQEPGRVLLLLDIPRNTIARLTGDPNQNREYHPKRDFSYRPSPPPPVNAAKYQPVPTTNGPVWRYQPKRTFGYRPKQNWDYNRDVYGRIWRQNILHDTRVVELTTDTPGVFVVPVGEVR